MDDMEYSGCDAVIRQCAINPIDKTDNFNYKTTRETKFLCVVQSQIRFCVMAYNKKRVSLRISKPVCNMIRIACDL